jgi:hypothetical protein
MSAVSAQPLIVQSQQLRSRQVGQTTCKQCAKTQPTSRTAGSPTYDMCLNKHHRVVLSISNCEQHQRTCVPTAHLVLAVCYAGGLSDGPNVE